MTFSRLCIVCVGILLLSPGSYEVVAFQIARGRVVTVSTSSLRRFTMAMEPLTVQAKARAVMGKVPSPSFTARMVQSLKSGPVFLKVVGVALIVALIVSQLFPTFLATLIEKFRRKPSSSSSTAWSPAKVVLPASTPTTPPSSSPSINTMDNELAKKQAEQIIKDDAERQARVVLAKSKEASAVAAAEEARQERIKAEKEIKAQQGTHPIRHSLSPQLVTSYQSTLLACLITHLS